MELWFWAVLLLMLGMTFGILEIFIPSAGLLALLSVGTIIASIVMGFRQGVGVGLAILFTALIAMPVFIFFAFQLWPKTPLGRRILLRPPKEDEVLPNDPEREFYRSLVGLLGKAKSKMLPGGMITIEGRTIDALSEGVPIEVGQTVRVIAVRGKKVYVRPTDEQADVPLNEKDVLSQPVDMIFEDPFDPEDKNHNKNPR